MILIELIKMLFSKLTPYKPVDYSQYDWDYYMSKMERKEDLTRGDARRIDELMVEKKIEHEKRMAPLRRQKASLEARLAKLEAATKNRERKPHLRIIK